MQGPPTNRSEANVGWVRSFFNSSLTTDQDREDFRLRCNLQQACSTDNMDLRGSSPFTEDSAAQWTQELVPTPDRTIPRVIVIVCGCLSGFLVLNALLRRLPRRERKSKLVRELEKLKERKFHPSAWGPKMQLTSDEANALPSPPVSRPISYFADTTRATPLASTPVGQSDFNLGDYLYSQKSAAASIKTFDTSPSSRRPRLSWREFSENLQGQLQTVGTAPPRTGYRHVSGNVQFGLNAPRGTRFSEDLNNSDGIHAGISSPPAISVQETETIASAEVRPGSGGITRLSPETPRRPPPSYSKMRTGDSPLPAEVVCLCDDDSGEGRRTPPASHQLRPTPRIGYLAGLLGFSCVLVTAIQFSLTFSPASVDPGADPHYETETWARKTIGAYFLNLVWVGRFFHVLLQSLS
jgi:hypothetical protein